MLELIKTIYDMNKIDEYEKQAFQSYKNKCWNENEAFEVWYKGQKDLGISLKKAAIRKKAILSTSIKDFLEIYQNKIVNIKFVEGEGIKEIQNFRIPQGNLTDMVMSVETAIKPMTDKEMGYAFLFHGAGGMVRKSAERECLIAKTEEKQSELMLIKAKSYEEVAKTIKTHCDKISDLLSRLNLLLRQSIKATEELIDDRGYDISDYTYDDKQVITTCMNIAKAVKDAIDTPILNLNGRITKASADMMCTSNEYLKKIKQV